LVSPAAASSRGISKSEMMIRRSGTSFKKGINQLADDSHKGNDSAKNSSNKNNGQPITITMKTPPLLTTRTTTDRHGNDNDGSND